MTRDIKDGGAVFPCFEMDPRGLVKIGGGLSKRDYFAAQALAGLIPLEGDFENRSPRGTAKEAYEYADAMLKARGGE